MAVDDLWTLTRPLADQERSGGMTVPGWTRDHNGHPPQAGSRSPVLAAISKVYMQAGANSFTNHVPDGAELVQMRRGTPSLRMEDASQPTSQG